MKKQRNWDWSKILSGFVFVSLLVSAVFVAIRLVLAPSQPHGGDFERLKSDYCSHACAVRPWHGGDDSLARCDFPQVKDRDPLGHDGFVCYLSLLCNLSWGSQKLLLPYFVVDTVFSGSAGR